MKLKFGSLSVRSCIHILFWGGLLVILYGSFRYGWSQALVRERVTNAKGFTVRVDTSYDIAKGVLFGLPPFLLFGILWRILMEPLHHLFLLLRTAASEKAS